jgi:hypothetical protein
LKKVTQEEQDKAQERVNAIWSTINTLVKEAEALCDETGADFSLNVAYGMGGQYRPDPRNADQWPGDPEDYDVEDGAYLYDDTGEDGGYWYSSSMSC